MLKTRIFAMVAAWVFSSLLTACNTTRGVGEDISAGGHAIEKSVSR